MNAKQSIARRHLVKAIVLAGLASFAGLFAGLVDAANPGAKFHDETPLSLRAAAPASASYGQVINLPVPPTGVVQVGNATSVLLRNHHGVSFTFRTTGLEPDTVYTLWMLVFNNTQFCVGSEITPFILCNPGVGDLNVPEVEGSVLWAAGGVSDAFGQINLAGSVYADGSTPGLKLFGPGLETPFRPELHLVLKRHGDAAELAAMDLLNTALTTNTGCVPACADVQAAAHVPTLHFRP